MRATSKNEMSLMMSRREAAELLVDLRDLSKHSVTERIAALIAALAVSLDMV